MKRSFIPQFTPVCCIPLKHLTSTSSCVKFGAAATRLRTSITSRQGKRAELLSSSSAQSARRCCISGLLRTTSSTVSKEKMPLVGGWAILVVPASTPETSNKRIAPCAFADRAINSLSLTRATPPLSDRSMCEKSVFSPVITARHVRLTAIESSSWSTGKRAKISSVVPIGKVRKGKGRATSGAPRPSMLRRGRRSRHVLLRKYDYKTESEAGRRRLHLKFFKMFVRRTISKFLIFLLALLL